MKIAVNTRLLIKDKLEGIGWFTYENLRRITTQHPEHTFYFLFDRKFHPSFIFADNVVPLVVPPQARHPLLYYLWFEFSVPRVLKKIGAQMFFSPDGYLSLKTQVPSMNVFHDLNFEHYPQDLPRAERRFYRNYFPEYAFKARRIATVSEYSKQDTVKLYGVDKDKIDVVYNGANERFVPLDEATRMATRKKYTGGAPYFLFIGSLHPRKNLARLFPAYDAFKATDTQGVKLLIVGEKKWWTSEIEDAYNSMQWRDEVVFSGRLRVDELHHVLASALATTYVSYFEGFGIPIVESFYCDVPVVTSNVTSMPEVAGDAALLVDPFSIPSITDALQQIATSADLREDLIEKGRERRKMFSWQKTSERLWCSMEKLIEQID
ncbi:MAG: glycosyltransferase family 1 protein [Bacteroidales bacterium]|nr:glycosyltransferase family 4 protein [Bacteroidales bacterium]MDD2631338.1 glycosyltransferase family 1 protein [Bacteroidales bacterium]MDD3525843.1 glycosyltransferase family 1 protein [Bacteroidales bacterium]MDD4177457.1 glycosyltransferase family 1 protein [Bacteroidales bacterium]MDD4740707.1 glycosyltransferase family 1 protein [Bacteroidales bacterium]